MSADRARDLLARIKATNVGAETRDQLANEVRHLVVAYLQQLPSTLLDERERVQPDAPSA
ncbi:MAG: hypothetical protein ACRDTC_19610 [Pseudonocardiaceae bacterium]